MTLDEAIKHAEEVAEENERICQAIPEHSAGAFHCAEEHRQLAEWLKELKQLREQTDGDLISRQAVLGVYDEWRYGKGITYTNGLQRLREQFEKLPSAEKTAEWILFDEDKNAYECSSCKEMFILIADTPKENNYNYCPNCGARMKREREEEE